MDIVSYLLGKNAGGGGGGGKISEYFVTEITENQTKQAYAWDLIKKLPVITVADNVTQISYLFNKDYYKVNGVGMQSNLPKVVCGNNVTNMANIYNAGGGRDGYVTQIDVTGLDTTNVTTIAGMFYNRGALTSIDLSTLDFSKVENCNSMFFECRALTLIDLSMLTGENLGKGQVNVNLSNMFYNCQNATRINLSNLNPSKILTLNSFCNSCYSLEELDIDKLDLGTYGGDAVTSIFKNCGSNLTGGQMTKIYVKDVASQTWILGLSTNDRPADWTTDNIIIAGSEADLRS